jgi:adenylosuccinate synthase
VARRGLRLADLAQPELFADRLLELTEYHNFVLEKFLDSSPVDYQQSLDQAMQQSEQISGLIGDVSARLHQLRHQGRSVMFEGAQGMLLDIDHGTYPFVTSSNTTAAAAAVGSGIGPLELDHVLGIVKAYTTRVGSGPFPTELFDETGKHLGERGHEFGATTGRPRRCGWLDAVALRRTAQVCGLSALCVTKLDVMDGIDPVKICVGYEMDGSQIDLPPYGAEAMGRCRPIYEELPGWRENTAGVRKYDELPGNARAYLDRMSELSGLPIDIISTGAERDDTIILRHPFS